MTNQFKLMIYSILSFVLFITLMGCNASQNATNEPKEELIKYEYVVTGVDSEGIYGNSTKDNTKIFLTFDTVQGLTLEEGSKIEVSYPKDDFETITKVSKIN
jgi:hypothetical protein